MSMGSTGSVTQQAAYKPIATKAEMAGVRGSLNQQKLNGQAALALIASAAVPIQSDNGQTIDVYV
jgi:hypothetical protein